MASSIPRLYAIIDAAQTGLYSPLAIFEALVSVGVALIQYRDKQGSSRHLFNISLELAQRARQYGVTFIVNDRADVALAVGADGVHLGQDDLPIELARRMLGSGRLAGVSTHSVAQVREADQSGADYIAFGPVFATRSKERPNPTVGLVGLHAARQATHRPLVAIGGVTIENACAVIEAGADSVAVISDLLRHPDVAVRAREFLHILGEKEGPDGTSSPPL